MKRWHEEEHIAQRRTRLHRCIYGDDHGKAGRFRKSRITPKNGEKNGSGKCVGRWQRTGRGLLLVGAVLNEGRRPA